jgi:LacI family transcriptional regulator
VKTTLKDVAALSGVHPSTVSRVLRGKESLQISQATRHKIFSAAKKLDYQPNQTARALRLKKSQTIGLVIPNIGSPYFAGIAKILDEESSKAGYTLIVCDTNENQKKEINAVNDLRGRGVDGLIIAPVQDTDEQIKDLVEKNFPLVLIDRFYDDFKTNAIVCNDEDSAYLAVSKLGELGHHRIGFICGRPNVYPVMRRIAGYKRAVLEHHLDLDPDLSSAGDQSLESGYHSAKKLFSLTSPPSALLLSGTIITIGVFKAIIEKNLSIPENISIIGFTDTIFAPYLRQPISTIHHQVKRIGHEAFKLLFKILKSDQPKEPETIIVKNLMIDRGSVGAYSQNQSTGQKRGKEKLKIG